MPIMMPKKSKASSDWGKVEKMKAATIGQIDHNSAQRHVQAKNNSTHDDDKPDSDGQELHGMITISREFHRWRPKPYRQANGQTMGQNKHRPSPRLP